MTPVCSVIIRSYNEQKHIRRLLEGIKRQTVFLDIEVILVDSGSDDDTVIIAREYGVKIININPEEFSFGRALNRGCHAAQGRFLLFASAHVYPLYTDWIEKMLRPFSDEKTALVYGRQVGCEISKYSEQQLFNKWFPPVSNYDQLLSFCNNANCAIRKSAWESQPYDENLTGLMVFNKTSFIGILPSLKCSGLSSTITSGNTDFDCSITTGLSVSITTLSIKGQFKSVCTI